MNPIDKFVHIHRSPPSTHTLGFRPLAVSVLEVDQIARRTAARAVVTVVVFLVRDVVSVLYDNGVDVYLTFPVRGGDMVSTVRVEAFDRES